MTWRDVVIGAIVTLIVSIVAGLAVWYLTKDSTPQEKLVYRVNQIATFSQDRNRISFVTIAIQNTGNKTARNVQLVSEFEIGAEIKEREIVSTSGLVANFTDSNPQPNRFELASRTLTPTETITVSVLVSGSSTKPKLGLRSDESTGAEDKPGQTERFFDRKDAVLFGAAGAALAALFPIIVINYLNALRRRSSRWPASRNGAGFTYLHQGMRDEAKKLLLKEIEEVGAEPHVLTNLALAYGLEGDLEKAEKHFRIATWWTRNDYELRLVEFNRAALAASQQNFSKALEHLRTALDKKKHRGLFLQFSDLSIYIQDAAKVNDDIRTLIEQTEKGS